MSESIKIAGMEIKIILLTPEYARKLLEDNYEKQRTLSYKSIDKMANDIENGRWNPCCGSLKIDRNGKLIDGQHRCSAVVKANIPVLIECIYGYPKDDFPLLDSGRSRSASDALKIVGAKNTCELAAFIKTKENYKNFGLVPKIFKNNLSNAATVGFYNDEHDPSFIRKAKVIRSALGGGSVAAYAFFIYLSQKVDKRLSDDFLRVIEEMTNPMAGKLAVKIAYEKQARRGADGETTFRLITKVWNAFAQGESLKIIKLNRNLPLKMYGINSPLGGDDLSLSQ